MPFQNCHNCQWKSQDWLYKVNMVFLGACCDREKRGRNKDNSVFVKPEMTAPSVILSSVLSFGTLGSRQK